MTELDELLAANRVHAQGFEPLLESRPKRGLAVLTCMDTRIDPLSPLGLCLGESHVLRNAGGRFTPDVERGLVISCHLYGTDTVVVLEHSDCGLLSTSDEALAERTGAPIPFLAIPTHETALHEDLEAIAKSPYLLPISRMFGLVYDLHSGEVKKVCHIER